MDRDRIPAIVRLLRPWPVAGKRDGLRDPGELLASEESIDACGEHQPVARLDPVGPVPVRGVTEPIWIVRVASNEA